MASPMSVLSRTLQNISLSKIQELESRRNSYESRKREYLDRAHAASNPRDRLRHLLDGCRELSPKASSDGSLANIGRWLDQSRHDASIPESTLAGFDAQLRKKLDVQSRKLDMAQLYSRLLVEWMEQSFDAPASGVAEDQRHRLDEMVKKFESVVFQPLETSETDITSFLDRFFDDDDSKKALEWLRGRVAEETEALISETKPFDRASVTNCIKGLLTEDLLTDEKRAILQNFLESDIAQDEIADVLNMRFVALDRWQWNAGPDGIPVMPRAGLNGKYRIWADDDVLQMIFVQYIGIKLSTIVKASLREFMRKIYTRTDQGGNRVPSKRDRDRRDYYLGSGHGDSNNVEAFRKDTYLDTFFLSSLPASETSLFEGGQQYDNDDDNYSNYSEDDDSDYENNNWAARRRRPARRQPQQPKKHANIRQELLRQLTADILLTQLRGVTAESVKDSSAPVAVVQTDIQWFGTSIPHSTAYAVMRYVGFHSGWISFFQKYLAAPLNLDSASSSSSQQPNQKKHGPRTRRRGVPMAHASEKLIGELVLFFMDAAVNRASGVLLRRLHDDIWFSGEPAAAARAWDCMRECAKILGLEFNRHKTGSVYLPGTFTSPDPQVTQSLPPGPVSIGFLNLDASSGKWVIDQAQVSAHVGQLAKQLGSCRSVLAWVQTWNGCMGRFFSHTFGEAAFCLGAEHVAAVLDTYSAICRRLFPDSASSNPVEHVRSMIFSRFFPDETFPNTLPDAFIALPLSLGGLALRNPFVPLFLVAPSINPSGSASTQSLALISPAAHLRHVYLAQERDEYLAHKKEFDHDEERGQRYGSRYLSSQYASAVSEEENNTFFSLAEYARFREQLSPSLLRYYKNRLLGIPGGEGIKLSRAVINALDDALSSTAELTPENKWFIALYADELMETYGGLSLVDKQFLPGGVLSMMKEKKVTWQMVL